MSEIYVIDDLHPEDNAMLQALYSRSPKGVMEHVEKVRKADSGNFMERFYVGYGHLSIADCGSTTIFLEHVSMFVAKAVQDWALYSGQEASTRYIDYSTQPILNPAGTPEGEKIQQTWMKFYNEAKEPLQAYLKTKYPRKEGEEENIYNKAIAARSFDILRGFLPAGSTTYLSWHTNLRQAHEKISLLEHHPLAEIRDLAVRLRAALQEKYKHSFSHPKYEKQEAYYEKWNSRYSYFSPDNHPDFEFSHNLQFDQLAQYADLLETRPFKTNLPNFLNMFGQCTFKFRLDFGSFRDIQRHRNGVCLMPLLSAKYGFYPWYLEQLPADLRAVAETLLAAQEKEILDLPVDELTRQYYFPMGYTIPVTLNYRLPAAVYVSELRSNKTVHPTLRHRAHQMGLALRENVPGLNMYLDLDPDDWDVRRGTQDIVRKDDAVTQDITVKNNERIFDNSGIGPKHGDGQGGGNPLVSAGEPEVLRKDN
jgi:thymidylate synthase ThyX